MTPAKCVEGTYRAKCDGCGAVQVQLEAITFLCVKCGERKWTRLLGHNDPDQRPAR